MTTAIEQLQEVFPHCYDCGAPFIADSEAEAAQFLRNNEFYKSTLLKNNPDRERIRVRLGYEWLCPTCFFHRNHHNEQAEHERRKTLLIERTFHNNRMPRSAIVQNFIQSNLSAEAENAEAWKLARSWNADFSMWVQGNKGTGKTYLGHCILNAALDKVLSIYEVNSVDFCQWVYRQGDREIRDASHVDVLLLDDIDKTEWRVDSLIALFRLMDIRHRDKHITIVTANVAPEIMKRRWKQVEGPDRNIVDPMIDRMQGFKRITLEGKSLR